MKTITEILQEFDEKFCTYEIPETEFTRAHGSNKLLSVTPRDVEIKDHYRKALTEALESVRLTEKDEDEDLDYFDDVLRYEGYNQAKREVDEKLSRMGI